MDGIKFIPISVKVLFNDDATYSLPLPSINQNKCKIMTTIFQTNEKRKKIMTKKKNKRKKSAPMSFTSLDSLLIC